MTSLESTIVNFVRTMPDQDLIALIHDHVSRTLSQREPRLTTESKNQFGQTTVQLGNFKFVVDTQKKTLTKRPQKARKTTLTEPLPTPMAKVYTTVKSHPGLTSMGISKASQVPDTTVRDYLKVLCQKGLVMRRPEGRRITYKV